jgi:23S rRNA (pseudouridine1915-N3)-methyltransferase
MKFRVVAVGHRMPAWVQAGFAEYASRMPRWARIELVALKPAAHGARALEVEAACILAALPAGAVKVVLDEHGELLTSAAWVRHIERWRGEGRDVAFVIGGAEGLAAPVKRAADRLWALSPLTLPHGLARVLLAEQLYRAVSILQSHPYHRE